MKIDVAQVASFGPYRLKVIVPVALAVASPSVATSLSEPLPTMIDAEACVVTVGLRGLTTTDSFDALQAFAVGLLLTSPL